MVFGNAGGGSGAGVGFTRDPATGARDLYFDFCFNGQGEDVVAGRRTMTDSDRLRRLLPAAFADLQAAQARLEALFSDAQDFEFTVQEGRLYLLQTRRAQRTPLAALRIAVDMVTERLITPVEALARLAGVDLQAAARTRFAAPLPAPLAEAVIAGPGVAVGPIALDAAEAERMAEAGTPPILVRPETATSDIAGMALAAGILTAAGSRTSHAAVVARQLGKPCLVGCGGLTIDMGRRYLPDRRQDPGRRRTDQPRRQHRRDLPRRARGADRTARTRAGAGRGVAAGDGGVGARYPSAGYAV